MISDLKVGKKYWYHKIPKGNPMNPIGWSSEWEPTEIVFDKVISHSCIGVKTYEPDMFSSRYRYTKISVMDLFDSYNDCLDDMIDDYKIQIKQNISQNKYFEECIDKLEKKRK